MNVAMYSKFRAGVLLYAECGDVRELARCIAFEENIEHLEIPYT